MSHKRRKKTWNMSNPLYRYLHSKGTHHSSIRKHKKRGSHSMARRRSSHRSSGGFGSTSKLLKIAAFSVGAALILPRVVPGVDEKIAGAAGGFFAGGPVGAAVGFVAAPALKGVIGGDSTSSAFKTYGSY